MVQYVLDSTVQKKPYRAEVISSPIATPIHYWETGYNTGGYIKNVQNSIEK